MNNGYFTIDGLSGYRSIIVQPTYQAGVAITTYSYTVQRHGETTNVYVRNANNERPADGTVVCVSVLAVK